MTLRVSKEAQAEALILVLPEGASVLGPRERTVRGPAPESAVQDIQDETAVLYHLPSYPGRIRCAASTGSEGCWPGLGGGTGAATCLVEQVAHTRSAHAGKHLDELGGVEGKEGDPGLARHRARQQRLARPCAVAARP